jgi:hypothetical protein
MKYLNTSLIFLLILIFHILVGAYSFYEHFLVDYDGWSIYMWKPFCYLAFTIAWFFAYRKKYIWGFVYIGLVMVEFLFFAVFRDEIWAATFGKVLFPIDLIFTAVLLLLFKKHFGILQGPTK